MNKDWGWCLLFFVAQHPSQREETGSGLSQTPTCLLFSPPAQKQLMVIGMDVYHAHNKGLRSVIGFVASMNPYVLPKNWGMVFHLFAWKLVMLVPPYVYFGCCQGQFCVCTTSGWTLVRWGGFHLNFVPPFPSPASSPSGIRGWCSRCRTRRSPTTCASAWPMPSSTSTR